MTRRYQSPPERLTDAEMRAAMLESDKIVAVRPSGERIALYRKHPLPNPTKTLVIQCPDDDELNALQAMVESVTL